MNEATRREPKPVPGKRVVFDEVIKDLRARGEFGFKKYGTPLMSHNGRDALVDLYQELMDALMYCKQALMERDDESE